MVFCDDYNETQAQLVTEYLPCLCGGEGGKYSLKQFPWVVKTCNVQTLEPIQRLDSSTTAGY
jgi:hypothetical protein